MPKLVALSLLATSLAMAAPAAMADSLDPDALKRLVHQDCGSCHGLTLKGGLGPDIRPETLEGYDPEILQFIILEGMPGTAMPPWNPLISEAEAAWIADYLLKGDTE
jgi:cytochrome c55X